MTLVSNPPLPVGVSVTFNLISTALITVNGPGSGNSSVVFNVTKNGLPITTTVGPTTPVSQGTRPFCSPNTQIITSIQYSNSITITNGDIIQINSTTVDTITDGQVASQSNCTTNIITQVSSVISTPTIIGDNCSSVIGISRQVQTNDFIYVPTSTIPVCSSYQSAPYDEFFEITYIDCDGVQQTDTEYCLSTICTYNVCARSIVSSTEIMNVIGSC
jgi:hypothetical protein